MLVALRLVEDLAFVLLEGMLFLDLIDLVDAVLEDFLGSLSEFMSLVVDLGLDHALDGVVLGLLWDLSWLVVEVNSDGEESWNTVGLGLPVVGEAVFLAWVGLVAVFGLGEPLLEDVVEPELALWDAGFTTVSEVWIDGVGLDNTLSITFIAALIISGGSSNKQSEEFHFI